MRCNLSRAFLGKPHNLVQDLSPNELQLPRLTARLLGRDGFLKIQNYTKRLPSSKLWLSRTIFVLPCYLSDVPASDARTVFERSAQMIAC